MREQFSFCVMFAKLSLGLTQTLVFPKLSAGRQGSEAIRLAERSGFLVHFRTSTSGAEALVEGW